MVIETGVDTVMVGELDTGTVIRELTIGPGGTYHGTGKPRGHPRKTLYLQQNRYGHRCPDNTVSGMSRALHTLKRTGWPNFKEHYRLVFVDIVPELRSGVRRPIGPSTTSGRRPCGKLPAQKSAD